MKDDLFALAVQLVAPSMPPTIFGDPGRTSEISVAVRIAYNALLDAHGKIPESGQAPTID
jgi:hypothetical protein